MILKNPVSDIELITGAVEKQARYLAGQFHAYSDAEELRQAWRRLKEKLKCQI